MRDPKKAGFKWKSLNCKWMSMDDKGVPPFQEPPNDQMVLGGFSGYKITTNGHSSHSSCGFVMICP